MQKPLLWNLGLAAALWLASPVVPAPALAQGSERGIGSIEEIVVTARKREENIQDLGLSVSAISASEIENNFARDLRDLTFISPSLVLDDTAQGPGGVASAYIRGIGVSEVEKNFDPAVGVVVDGIFLGTMTGSITKALDLERVEVLRGPQGTLFGRNTIGGVINLQRSRPTGEFGGKVRASYGNYEDMRFDGLLNMALGDDTALKLTGSYHDQRKGYYENVNTGRDDGQSQFDSFGFNLLHTFSEDFEAEYTGLWESTDQDTPPLLYAGQPGQIFCDNFEFCAPSLDTPLSGDRWKTSQDGPGPNDAHFAAATQMLELRWSISDNWRADFITGYWRTEESVDTDWDATPALLFHTIRPADYQQWTRELRLTYDDGERLAGTLGLYVWESEYEIGLVSYIGFTADGVNPLPGPDPLENPLAPPQTSEQENESLALFFEGDYRLGEALTLTLGGRYTKDSKNTKQTGIVNAKASDNWYQFTPKAGLRYQLADDAMLYATWSAGYRSGGFNGRVDSERTAVTPYDEETVDNYELGFKSEWLRNRLRVNGAYFYMDYEDKQEELQLPSDTSLTGQVTLVTNASTAAIQGFELDLTWYPSEALHLRGSLGWLDAEYDEFTFVVFDAAAQMSVNRDFSHLNLRRAPEITASLSATYEVQIGEGRAWALLGWHFIDDYEVDFANKPELSNDAQNLLNASFNYAWREFQVSVYGHNLSEEDGYSIGFDVAGLWSYAATRPPRTFGIELSYSFE